MIQQLYADRSTDHPTREPSDHGNVDPPPKHPKVAQRSRSGPRPARPAERG